MHRIPDDPKTAADHVRMKLNTKQGSGVSRRSLLLGSAGMTLSSMFLNRSASAKALNDRASVKSPKSLSRKAYPVTSRLVDITRKSTDLPGPISRKESATVNLELETIELEGRLDERSTFKYWTFNGKVPGPFARVRVGDTVTVKLKNRKDSDMFHNVDLHAVNGPGGGASFTTAAPGEERSFNFKALNPGLYVYHCAVPPVAMHIANGMYGLILVEPEEGLPPVDREFYVMQGELYTEESFGTEGLLSPSYEKLLNERPEYFVFNGSLGALTDLHPMKARTGETIRIYFGVGGPNYTSSLHVIGEIFSRTYQLGSLTAAPLTDVQTVGVPAGGATIVEIKLDVPGRYVLVDHALSRAERGLVAWLDVGGPKRPEIFAAITT